MIFPWPCRGFRANHPWKLFQRNATQVAELLLIAQYYGALKYAAESTQNAVELTPRHKPRKARLGAWVGVVAGGVGW